MSFYAVDSDTQYSTLHNRTYYFPLDRDSPRMRTVRRTIAKMSQTVEMGSDIVKHEMDRFMIALGRETTQALDAMQNHLQKLNGPKKEEFKINFLKSANYQLMTSYKLFEMKQMMGASSNNTPNSMDFLLMPPPSMQMNTPFVLSGERMSNARPTQSNATPFLVNRCDPMDFGTDWNVNTSKMNGIGRSEAGSSSADRIVFRTNGVNGTNGSANGKNDFSSVSKASKHQFKVPNARANTLNAAKRDLFKDDDVMKANGLSPTFNGVPSITTSTRNNSESNLINLDVSNASAVITNKSLFANGTHTPVNPNQMNNSAGSTNSTFDHLGAPTNSNHVSNVSERSSVFSRLNYNANNNTSQNNGMESESCQNLQTIAGACNKRYDAIFAIDDSIDDGFGNAEHENGDDDDDDGDADDEQTTNFAQFKFNVPMVTKAMLKQQTNVPNNLFRSVPFKVMNGPSSATKSDGDQKENQQPNGATNSAEFQRKSSPSKIVREWMCFYCNEAREKNVRSFVFKTIDETYEHWKLKHSNDAINVAGASAGASASASHKELKPFRFYSVDLLTCFMNNCTYYSTFQGLQKHHDQKHQNHLFVPVMNGRCALCMYSGTGLREHKCASLENGMQLKLYNPVLLSDDDLAELQAVECKEFKEKRPKQIECQNCRSIFETRQDMTQHHHQQHGEISISYKKIDADVKPVEAFICHCCNGAIQPNEYVDHIKFMAKQRWDESSEHQPTWNGWFRQLEMQHLKSKVVFSNGLVLFKQNLICTDLGNHSGFRQMAQKIYNSLKFKHSNEQM